MRIARIAIVSVVTILQAVLAAPQGFLQQGGWRPAYTPQLVQAEWAMLKRSIAAQLANTALIGPTFIRLAWHDAATYSAQDGSGGPHANLWFAATWQGANASDVFLHRGLERAINALEPLYQAYGGRVSRADVWSFAGAVAASHLGTLTAQAAAAQQAQTPQRAQQQTITVPWRPGRADYLAAQPLNSRLPTPDDTVLAMEAKFARMGFTTGEMVALIGAHSLGRCQATTSGYRGFWTSHPNRLSNSLFTNLLGSTYYPVAMNVPVPGAPVGPETARLGPSTVKFQFNDTRHTHMMLQTDFFLGSNTRLAPWTRAYAGMPPTAFIAQHFVPAFVKLLELGMANQLMPYVVDTSVDFVAMGVATNMPVDVQVPPGAAPTEQELQESQALLAANNRYKSPAA
ncbi:heme peroxidase [Entophlyctis helioformis]|nr:heme peroxidase [Entophlyctis helioformis]